MARPFLFPGFPVFIWKPMMFYPLNFQSKVPCPSFSFLFSPYRVLKWLCSNYGDSMQYTNVLYGHFSYDAWWLEHLNREIYWQQIIIIDRKLDDGVLKKHRQQRSTLLTEVHSWGQVFFRSSQLIWLEEKEGWYCHC